MHIINAIDNTKLWSNVSIQALLGAVMFCDSTLLRCAVTPNFKALVYGQLADGPTRRHQLADV